jgi:hypothetical protein
MPTTDPHLPRRALPDDGQADVQVMSADTDAAHAVWDRIAAALGHDTPPRERHTGDEEGVRLYGLVDAPDRPLPGLADASDTHTAHLMHGDRITLDELAVNISATAVLLAQLARAAETPETPVELADTIDALRRHADGLRDQAERLSRVARIVEGDVPLARSFLRGDPWGAAALDDDRDDYGGPAVFPTGPQLLLLAGDRFADRETMVTYPEHMAGIPASLSRTWESKTAADRRRRQRDAAIALEELRIDCERCGAGNGEHCRTNTGRAAERPHTARQRDAEASVDARIGWIGEDPVAV